MENNYEILEENELNLSVNPLKKNAFPRLLRKPIFSPTEKLRVVLEYMYSTDTEAVVIERNFRPVGLFRASYLLETLLTGPIDLDRMTVSELMHSPVPSVRETEKLDRIV